MILVSRGVEHFFLPQQKREKTNRSIRSRRNSYWVSVNLEISLDLKEIAVVGAGPELEAVIALKP